MFVVRKPEFLDVAIFFEIVHTLCNFYNNVQ